jgi:hypothetical protein
LLKTNLHIYSVSPASPAHPSPTSPYLSRPKSCPARLSNKANDVLLRYRPDPDFSEEFVEEFMFPPWSWKFATSFTPEELLEVTEDLMNVFPYVESLPVVLEEPRRMSGRRW